MVSARRAKAGFPTGKTFDAWKEADSSIPVPTQRGLRTLEWIERAEALCVCGPSGTGKSHFLEALGQAAIDSFSWPGSCFSVGATVGSASTTGSVRTGYFQPGS